MHATLVASAGVSWVWRDYGIATACRVPPGYQTGQHHHMAANWLPSGHTFLRSRPLLQGLQLER